MNCPACSSKLYRIQPGEYSCPNPDCPERDSHQSSIDAEWYGNTQKEINKMYRRTSGGSKP